MLHLMKEAPVTFGNRCTIIITFDHQSVPHELRYSEREQISHKTWPDQRRQRDLVKEMTRILKKPWNSSSSMIGRNNSWQIFSWIKTLLLIVTKRITIKLLIMEMNVFCIKLIQNCHVQRTKRQIRKSSYDALDKDVDLFLPEFHALTGCDYNPAFNKREKTPPEVFEREYSILGCFRQIRQCQRVSLASICSDFFKNSCVKCMASTKSVIIMLPRWTLLQKHLKLKNPNILQKPTNAFDGSLLPPCDITSMERSFNCKLL